MLVARFVRFSGKFSVTRREFSSSLHKMVSQKKRFVVACDGTWMNSDSGYDRKSWLPWATGMVRQNPTNVTRICHATLPLASDGTDQVIYYHSGVGSENSFTNHLFGGVAGDGISENIREAYAFVCRNWREGDEIVLIGFSRGAFTARSIAGLITDMGLLTNKGLEDFYPVFADWENQTNNDYKAPPAIHLPEPRMRFNSKNRDAYRSLLQEHEMSRIDIPIKAVAVWDTVGSLGVPDNLTPQKRKAYCFVNTEIGANIENAFHALALDESRKPFSPTIWEMPEKPHPNLTLKQCWFPGVHSNVGGSYADTNIADITLAWLVTQLAPHMEFDHAWVLKQQERNKAWYTHTPEGKAEGVRPWAMGQVYDSSMWIMGAVTRTPGIYCRTDPRTGAATNQRLRNTCEFVHPCVRARVDMRGRGIGDAKVPYEPLALSRKQGWRLYKPNERFEGGENPWPQEYEGVYKWAAARPAGKKGPVFIAEETMDGDLGKTMVRDSPEFGQYKVLQELAG